MAKKKYRLEALLRIKLQERKKAEAALARALAELQKARKRLKELEEAKETIVARQKEARGRMAEAVRGGGLVGEGCFHVNFLRKLKEDLESKKEEIEDQKGVIEECREEVAKMRRRYVEAVKQLRVMEEHKALWVRKVRREITRQEEREMDELGQTIHRLKRWRGEKAVFEV